jgi:hypothetical protein
MPFSKKKFLELLKEANKIGQEDKFLFDENNPKNDEFIEYMSLLKDQISWQSRKEYYEILYFFVNKKITLEELFNKFYGLRESKLQAFIIWKNNFEKKARGFTYIIFYLHHLISLCDSDIILESNLKDPELIEYEISEQFLRVIMKKTFLPQIYEYCKKS